uniref:Ventral anterior homeobox 2 n=1 Tax=Anser brachyrhynchus TaxID=132585 RepID=A0A8B9I719_9AVES
MQGPPLGNGCGQDVGWRWRVVQQAQVLDVGPGVPAPPRAAPARGRLRADICVVIPPERGRGLRPPPAHGPLALHCGSIVPGDARGLCRSVAVLGRCCSGPKGASPSCQALTRMSSHPSPSLTCLCLSVCPSFPSLSLSASPTPLLCQGGTEAWRCHQVKVWFQNRRTKQKKDQSRDSEKRSTSTSESFATCNILRLLEQGRLLSVPAPPSLLSPTSHPVGSPAGSGSGVATPGTTSPGLGGRSSPPGTGAFSLQVPALAASSSSSSSSSSSARLPAAPLCFGAPLLGGLHDLPSAYGLGSSAFEPYTRLERKDNSIPSKKPSP